MWIIGAGFIGILIGTIIGLYWGSGIAQDVNQSLRNEINFIQRETAREIGVIEKDLALFSSSGPMNRIRAALDRLQRLL